jgi:hypothetical protein
MVRDAPLDAPVFDVYDVPDADGRFAGFATRSPGCWIGVVM